MINFILGDSRFFWSENIKYLSHLPYAWDSSINSGIGINDVNTLWITSYLNLTASFSHLGLSWEVINILFWIIPILVISFVSSFLLARNVIGKNSLLSIISGIIFTGNTYFLSIFLGGQFGVSFAYAFTPMVFLAFINLVKSSSTRSSLTAGLILGLQVLFDPRIAFLTFIGVAIYYLFNAERIVKAFVLTIVIPPLVVLGMHLYWVLPLIFYPQSLLPAGYDSVAGAAFFSFADLENSISLLHPNWPENIFGKTYFMRPEFLLLPIFAFGSLLFLKPARSVIEQISNRTILFFALLALMGAFLGKGANDPLGQVFIWIFENVPGGSLFRDPTKFYLYVAVAFSVLIPYTLFSITERIKNKQIKNIPPILFIVFWLFTLRLLFVSNVQSITPKVVPEEYIKLKDLIVSDNQYFRTLWIPAWQRFGFFTDENPPIGRGEIFKQASLSGMLTELRSDGFEKVLQDLSVKYVIVPFDSEGEIFIEERKYSEKLYRAAVTDIEKVKYLKEVESIGKIRIFEVADPRDHFWSPSTSLRAKYKFINPTKYEVEILNAKKGEKLIFSESFDKNWIAKNSAIRIRSSASGILNSFELPDGSYNLTVEYEPQKLVYIGLVASLLSSVGPILYILFEKRLKRIK